MIFIYIVLLVISCLFYILFEGVISLLIFGFVCLLPILLFAFNFCAKCSIEMSLTLESKSCGAGQNVPISIEIRNNSIIPILSAEITLEYTVSSCEKKEKIKINTPIYPLNTQTLTAAFSSEHLGLVTCRISRVRLYDMLKITRLKLNPKRIIQRDTSLLVIPEAIELTNSVSDYSDFSLDSDNYSPDKPGSDPSEIFSIHEYTDGDKMSRIHWKLTAKQDKLMVKDYSLPLADSCVILCDYYIPPELKDERAELYDTSAELSASVSALLQSVGVRHKIEAYNEKTQSFVQYSVFDEQSQFDACTNLLASGTTTKPNLSVYAAVSNDEAVQRCGHLMLVCAYLDDKAAEALVHSGLAYRYTVLLCRTQGEYRFALPNTDIDIIPVDCSNVRESIAELVL